MLSPCTKHDSGSVALQQFRWRFLWTGEVAAAHLIFGQLLVVSHLAESYNLLVDCFFGLPRGQL